MKKLFIAIAAVALVFSASCTKVNPEEKKAEKISFQVANYVPATKAGEVSFLKEFAADQTPQFKCKAFMKGVGVDGLQDFFGTTGETITWNATAKEWAPSHDYYWPKDAASYINFFSWYDTGAGPIEVTNGSMTWGTTESPRTIGTGDNIMYADPAWHFQKNNNPATYGPNFNPTEATEGVPTLFHHALAQVEFRAYAAKLTNGTATWTIKLTGLELKVKNQGIFALTATGENAEPAATVFNQKGKWDDAEWTATGAVGNIMPTDGITVNKAKVTEGTQEYTSILSNQSVLPQDLSEVSFKFNLDITTTYANNVSNREVIEVEIPMAAGTTAKPGFGTEEWALNTKYIYTIQIVPGENRVLFDPAVEKDWETVTVDEKLL